MAHSLVCSFSKHCVVCHCIHNVHCMSAMKAHIKHSKPAYCCSKAVSTIVACMHHGMQQSKAELCC